MAGGEAFKMEVRGLEKVTRLEFVGLDGADSEVVVMAPTRCGELDRRLSKK